MARLLLIRKILDCPVGEPSAHERQGSQVTAVFEKGGLSAAGDRRIRRSRLKCAKICGSRLESAASPNHEAHVFGVRHVMNENRIRLHSRLMRVLPFEGQLVSLQCASWPSQSVAAIDFAVMDGRPAKLEIMSTERRHRVSPTLLTTTTSEVTWKITRDVTTAGAEGVEPLQPIRIYIFSCYVSAAPWQERKRASPFPRNESLRPVDKCSDSAHRPEQLVRMYICIVSYVSLNFCRSHPNGGRNERSALCPCRVFNSILSP